MHYSYQISADQLLIIVTIRGEFTVEELISHSKRMLADPSFDTRYDGIVDMRKATANISKVELLGLADLLEQTGAFAIKTKWAFITTDPIVLTLTETYKNRLNQGEYAQAFSTAQAAADFLNNPEVLNYIG